jgi:hypothetical protein
MWLDGWLHASKATWWTPAITASATAVRARKARTPSGNREVAGRPARAMSASEGAGFARVCGRRGPPSDCGRWLGLDPELPAELVE